MFGLDLSAVGTGRYVASLLLDRRNSRYKYLSEKLVGFTGDYGDDGKVVNLHYPRR